MPLRKQLLETPLSTGLNQKSDPRTLAVSGAVTMQNCVALKTGAIRKRFGHTALSKGLLGGGSIAACVACGGLNGAPWMTDGSTMYGYSDAGSEWSAADIVPEAVALDRISVDSGANGVSDMDVGYANGFAHVAYALPPAGGTVGPIYMAVFDASNQAVVVPPVLIAAGDNAMPRVVVCGSTVVIAWMTNAGTLTVESFAAGSANRIAGPVGVAGTSAFPFDAVPIVGDTTRLGLAYASGASSLTATTISSTSLLTIASTSVAIVGGTAAATVSVSARATAGETFWVAASTPDTGVQSIVTVAFSDPSLAVSGTQYTPYAFAQPPGKTIVERIDATHACLLWSPSGVGTPSIAFSWVMAQNVVISGGAITSSGGSYYTGGVLLHSRTAVVGSSAFAVVLSPSLLQGTLYLAAVDAYNNGPNSFTGGMYGSNALRPVATVSPRLAKGYPALPTEGTVTPNLVNTTALGASVWGTVGYSSTTPTRQSIYFYPFDFASFRRFSFGEVYNDEILAAGAPQAFDGNNVFEAGFTSYPEILAAPTGSGGSLSAGQYQYTVIYSMVDSHGQVHRSSNGNVITLTAVNGDSVHITIPPLAFTDRRAKNSALPFQVQVFAEVYRTVANGSILYFDSSNAFPNNPTLATAATFQNSFVVTDGASDASISTNALLYTTGGVLQNFNPPSSRIAISHRNRFWLAGCDDPTQIWPSREVTPGEYPGFNEALVFNATGAVRALASLDDKLIIFVQRGANYGIEYLTGDGPSDEGTNSDWSPIQPIPSDVGAIDQRSVVVGPFGVLFKANSGGPTGSGGIYLLTRDLQVQYLSKPVEDLLARFPVVTSATLHPNNGRVYFTVVDSDASPSFGERLVWDYTNGDVWSSDTLFDGDTSNTITPVRSAMVSNTSSGVRYQWATSAGRVYRETTGIGALSYTDAGQWITTRVQSAWLKPALAGFARFWKMLLQGDVLDPANLTMQLTFDYSGTYTETSNWTAGAIAGFYRAPQLNIQMTPGNQKAESISVTLTDSAPTGGPSLTTGQGFSWATLTLEMGVKDGRYQNLPTRQRT